MRVSSARWRQWSGSLKCGALDMERKLHFTRPVSYATVKVGAAPRAAVRAAPARDHEPIGEPRVAGQLLSNCPAPIQQRGLQSTPQDKTHNSNGCSDIHHEIGS